MTIPFVTLYEWNEKMIWHYDMTFLMMKNYINLNMKKWHMKTMTNEQMTLTNDKNA